MSKFPLLLLFILLLTAVAQPSTAVPSSDTTIVYATYLGTAAVDNEAVALEINPTQELVIALNLNGTGYLRRLSGDGRTLLQEISTGGRLDDMDINRATGEVAAVGDFGLRVYTADLTSEQASRAQSLASGHKRVGIATDGRIITSAGNQISLWSATGSLLSQNSIASGRTVLDVAISTEQGHVYVGGFWQASGQYQSPFLYAYANNNLTTLAWRSYDYWKSLVDAAQPYALTADSRLYRIAIGRDNQLYILGEAHGGVTVFKTNGRRFDGMQGSDLTYISAVEIDNWNRMHNTNSAKKAFVARVNYQTGWVEQGQFILPRWDNNGTAGAGSSTRNFTVSEGSLAADEQGNVYVGGSVGTYMKGRFEGTLTLNGQPLGAQPANDKEMTLYIVNHDFTQRQTWAAFTQAAGDGSTTGIAASNGVVAISGRSTQGTLFTTADATRPTPFNPSNSALEDAYLAVLSAPADLTAVQLAAPAVGFTTRPVRVTATAVPQNARLPLTYRLFVDEVLVIEQTVNSATYQMAVDLPTAASYALRLEIEDGQSHMAQATTAVVVVVPQEQFLPFIHK